MEISNEIKAKVFAQYLGQKIWDGNIIETNFDEITKLNFKGYKLILKPLSAITDEGALEFFKVCNFLKPFSNCSDKFLSEYIKTKIFGNQINYNNISGIGYQFLQNKGYDLPNYLLSGKTLHEAGLAIYE